MEADYVLDYDVLSMTREHRVYVVARIKGKPQTNDRRPLNVSVVIDRSGSMAGEKLDYVKRATQFLVQHLSQQDQFSLVAYDKTVAVCVPPMPVSNKDYINQVIHNLRAGGTTNLSGGWLQGCQLVAEQKAEGQVNRVLLLSDGLANEGVTDPLRLAAMAHQKRDEGITTTTMGVGMGFNEDLMQAMATQGGGAFYFIDNADQAPVIFAEELQDLLSVVAQNLTITLMPSTKIQMVRQLNMYPFERRDFQNIFRLGDLFADEAKTLVLELHIPALNVLGEVEVARLTFSYDELGEDSVTHRTLELPIVVSAIRDEEYDMPAPNPEVVKSVLMMKAAQARKEAMTEADQGNFRQASDLLTEVANEIYQSGIIDADLTGEHNMLREEAMDMELGSDRYDTHSRKTASAKISYQTTRMWNVGKVETHNRMKASRGAMERHQAAPRFVHWNHQSMELSADKIRIGRHPDNDIVIAEAEVSKFHCQIVRDGDDIYLEDLSRNGTYANGGRVHDRFRLSAGDIVTVGGCLFTFK